MPLSSPTIPHSPIFFVAKVSLHASKDHLEQVVVASGDLVRPFGILGEHLRVERGEGLRGERFVAPQEGASTGFGPQQRNLLLLKSTCVLRKASRLVALLQ